MDLLRAEAADTCTVEGPVARGPTSVDKNRTPSFGG
jgi:hypothetical protein